MEGMASERDRVRRNPIVRFVFGGESAHIHRYALTGEEPLGIDKPMWGNVAIARYGLGAVDRICGHDVALETLQVEPHHGAKGSHYYGAP